MPVRFQVDPDFYDHPKSIGMSDAAVALWTRAGSYSAAKLLDGFIAEHVLSTLSRTPDEASAELVARGLWRRVRGGFQFHQYGERNLLKADVEADREYERKRKAERRAAAKAEASRPVDNRKTAAKPQANGNSVPPGHPPGLPDMSHRDSGQSPSGSVSVSVSVSESVSGRGGPRPDPACREHRDDPDPPACRRCKTAREAVEAWDAAFAVAHAMAEARTRDNQPKCAKHRGQLAHNCAGCRSERLAADA